MSKNPFDLNFGVKPQTYIERTQQKDEVIKKLISQDASTHIMLVLGVRGSGKTVFINDIRSELKEDSDWIVLNINVLNDIIHQIASQLANRNELTELFRNADINLSALGLGLTIHGVLPITDEKTAVIRMLQKLKKQNKKVLIVIDAISSTEPMQIFAHDFQEFTGEDLPIYLLGSGLFENIADLQNKQSLTFLYRAPRIILAPLNINFIAGKYARFLNIDRVKALEMAKATNGYSYAYQALGYLCFEQKLDWKEVLLDYDGCFNPMYMKRSGPNVPVWTEMFYPVCQNREPERLLSFWR